MYTCLKDRLPSVAGPCMIALSVCLLIPRWGEGFVENALKFLALSVGEVGNRERVCHFRPPYSVIGKSRFETCVVVSFHAGCDCVCLFQTMFKFVLKVAVWC